MCRHGHISTLHIWPARRPLAAARAALIATLLPDPGNADERNAILKRMAGTVVEKTERKRLNGRVIEKTKEVTEGGILHWGRENGDDLQWFRDEIRKAYGGRPPKVLDPFAGGGAIPLEAMRLGCEVTAMDINPVAWFILKCTLEYPQKLAGQTRPLPEFAVADREFMASFLKAKGYKSDRLRTALQRLGHGDGGETQLEHLPPDDSLLEADLAWHVRAWGRWVLGKARAELAAYYPTYAECEPLDPDQDYEPRPPQLVEVDEDGVPQLDPLQLRIQRRLPQKPAQPALDRQADCRLPLGAHRELQRLPRHATLAEDALAVQEGAEACAADAGAERRGNRRCLRRRNRRTPKRRERRAATEHDKRLGAGTMSRTGATCPCCKMIMTMEDIRLEGRVAGLGAVMTAVVVEGAKGKGIPPTDRPRTRCSGSGGGQTSCPLCGHPFGLPDEPLPSKDALGFRAPLYGLDTWRKLFTNRPTRDTVGSY